MRNIDKLSIEPLPPELAAIATRAGHDPAEFVRLYAQPDAWAIYFADDFPPRRELEEIPGAFDDEYSDTFIPFWWEIRATREWICDAGGGLEAFEQYFPWPDK